MRDELQPLVREQMIHAEQRRVDLAVFVERLTSALARLQKLPARDGPCDPDCDFLHDRAHRPPISVDLTPIPPPSDAHAVDLAPVACSLTVGEHGARVREWRTLLDGAHSEILPHGGMKVRLPIARTSELAQLVVAEQRCCPFFTFRLTLAGDHVQLNAYAPGGVKPLVAGLFGEQGSSC